MPFYPPQTGNRYAAPRPSDASPALKAGGAAIAAGPGNFTPGPAAPTGCYASTSSSGRPPAGQTAPGGGGSITEDEQPGWLVRPGQYVALRVTAVETVEAVADGRFTPAAVGHPDNTSPTDTVHGQAGLNHYTRERR